MPGTVQFNEEHKGVEIKFDEKPAQEVINRLKEKGFRYNGATKVWYHKHTPENKEAADEIVDME